MKTAKVMLLTAWVMAGAAGLANAHCDSMDGPVVVAARAALESGAPAGVLAWVRADDEAAIREAFRKAREVRKLGGKAADLADIWFFETLVRVHRAGEGEPYTGLKPAGSAEPIVKGLDAAIVNGDITELAGKISAHAGQSIKEKFGALLPLKKEADKSVEKGRQYVAAYVEFIHYVENVKNAVHGAGHHGEAVEAEPPAHKE